MVKVRFKVRVRARVGLEKGLELGIPTIKSFKLKFGLGSFSE